MNIFSPLCRSTNPKAPLGACNFHLNIVPCSWLLSKCQNLKFSSILQLPSWPKRHHICVASLRIELALCALLSHSLLCLNGHSERVRSASITYSLFRWNSLNLLLPAIDLAKVAATPPVPLWPTDAGPFRRQWHPQNAGPQETLGHTLLIICADR